MRPLLNEGEYVFCSIKEQLIDLEKDFENIIFCFKEQEGVTIVCTKVYAIERNYLFQAVFSWITLEVHSSLEAVGLTAAFSNALATANISCNVVAGFYHDHIFVQKEKADEAMQTLLRLSNATIG